MSKLKYGFRVQWSDEDGGFIATCPEFPTLSSVGDSPVEALTEAEVALELLIEAYQDQAIPLPKPVTLQPHSGQIRLRMSKNLHARAAAAAEEQGVSLNQYLVTATAAAVGAQPDRVIKSGIQRPSKTTPTVKSPVDGPRSKNRREGPRARKQNA